MNFTISEVNNITVAEVTGGTLTTVSDALDLIGNAGYQGTQLVIINEDNLSPDFFNLKTGLAGEILQKFTNYTMNLAIVGDFSKYTSKALQDFIYESNKGGRITFVTNRQAALLR